RARETPDLRGRVGSPAPRRWLGRRSCRHPVGLENLDRHLDCRVYLLAPQFASSEDDRVEPLRALAGTDRRSIRKDVASAHRFDRAELAPRVAWQAGLRSRIDVFCVSP